MIYTLIGAILLFSLFPFFRRRKYVDHLMRAWIWSMVKTLGVKITVEGKENIETDASYVFVANHQSLLDIPALFIAIPARLRMLAKKELFRIPIFGWGMTAVGHIAIDRENKEKALKSIDHAIERLKRENIAVVVFPEGTRSPDGAIHPFKKGGYVLALRSERPVVPVTIIGSRSILSKRSFKLNKGTIHVIIDKPIPTEGMTLKDRGALVKQTQEIIENRFNSAGDNSGK
jgi:1-acyl-sn-glycerol-3-phosphate acyltransferase